MKLQRKSIINTYSINKAILTDYLIVAGSKGVTMKRAGKSIQNWEKL